MTTPFPLQNATATNRPPLCEYIILAEFDIDTGSTVRIQYPTKVPGYESDWFAENMLPEGVHNRVSDYTYMLLNRDRPILGEIAVTDPSSSSSATECDQHGEGDSQMHFLFGINLCRTKYDSTVRRGAIVKAMAIFSRYSFIELFKKPLDLALEAYFESKSISIIESLFNSLNAVNMSEIAFPNALEQGLMRRGIVFEPIGSRTPQHCPQSWNYEVNFKFNFPKELPQIQTQGQAQTDDNVAKDDATPAAVSTSLSATQDTAVSTGSFTENTLITASIPLYRTIDEVGDINISLLLRVFGEATMRIYNGILCGQRVLFVGYSHAAADVAQMVCSAVALVAPPLRGICRRMFPYANLTDLSFLQCPGYIAGVTNPMFQENDSWWDLLCVLDLPNNTGTVKTVEEKRAEDEKTKSNKPHPPSSNAHSNSPLASVANDDQPHHFPDSRFIIGLLSAVQHRIAEDVVRQKFHDYTTNILCQAQAINSIYRRVTSGESSAAAATGRASLVAANEIDSKIAFAKERKNINATSQNLRKLLNANLQRSVLVTETSEFSRFPTHPWQGLAASEVHKAVNEIDREIIGRYKDLIFDDSSVVANRLDGFALKAAIFRLHQEVNLSLHEVAYYLIELFLSLTNETNAQALLLLLPESSGGLHVMGAALMSTNPVARYIATRIIQVINSFESTKAAVSSMNGQIKFALERNIKQINNHDLHAEVKVFIDSHLSVDTESLVLSSEGLVCSIAGIQREVAGSSAGVVASPSSAPTISTINPVMDKRQSMDETPIDMSDYIP